MKKFAFILAGCGGLDGSEVHEALYSFLAVKQQGCEYVCFAEDKKQFVVKNYINNSDMIEERNVLKESARLTRKNIKPLEELNVNDFDVLFFPGGMGSAMNISTYAINGEDYDVSVKVQEVINNFKTANKPICAVCIAPMILAKTLTNIKITTGNDTKTANVIKANSNEYIKTNSGDICIDENNKIITSPCFMSTTNISVIYEEVYKVVENAIRLCNS